MAWYQVTKRINGRLYLYWQRTYRVGKSVKTENKYIGPASSMRSVDSIPGGYDPSDEKEMQVIQEMASQIKKGVIFPTILIDEHSNVIDGLHRLEAHRLAGKDTIAVTVKVAKTVEPTKSFYHGTLETFDDFNNAKVGTSSGWKNASFGTFFLDNRARAAEFPDLTRGPGDRRPVQVKEARLSLKNLLDLTLNGIFTKASQAPLIVEILGGDKGMSPTEALELLNDTIGLGELGELHDALYGDIKNKALIQSHGYDGIVSQYGRDENGEVIKEYVVFDTSQIATTAAVVPEESSSQKRQSC